MTLTSSKPSNLKKTLPIMVCYNFPRMSCDIRGKYRIHERKSKLFHARSKKSVDFFIQQTKKNVEKNSHVFIGHRWFNFLHTQKKSLEKKFRASPWNMLGSLPLLLTAPEQRKVIFPFQTLTKVAAAPTTKLFSNFNFNLTCTFF